MFRYLLKIIILTITFFQTTQTVVEPVPTAMPPCRRYNFTVTRPQVDWDTLVAPAELEIGACWGSCPMPAEGENFTFGRILMDRFRILNPTLVPYFLQASCCVPKSYQRITVLEAMGNGEIRIMNISDVVIRECGCS